MAARSWQVTDGMLIVPEEPPVEDWAEAGRALAAVSKAAAEAA